MKRVLSPMSLLLMTACSGLSTMPSLSDMGEYIPEVGMIAADAVVNSTPSEQVGVGIEAMWGGYTGLIYLVTDPFAPNWQIEEASFPNEYYHLALKMKRVYAGGAGEARQIFNRRAQELMRRGGFRTYEVVEYREGLESSVLGSQRVASGVVRLKGS